MSVDRRLVLASASPARLALMRQAGLAPEVVVSQGDESTVRAARTRPSSSWPSPPQRRCWRR